MYHAKLCKIIFQLNVLEDYSKASLENVGCFCEIGCLSLYTVRWPCTLNVCKLCSESTCVDAVWCHAMRPDPCMNWNNNIGRVQQTSAPLLVSSQFVLLLVCNKQIWKPYNDRTKLCSVTEVPAIETGDRCLCKRPQLQMTRLEWWHIATIFHHIGVWTRSIRPCHIGTSIS